MWRAIETAARLVRPGGQFALAIYSATPLDPVWRIEKRIYSKGPKALQWVMREAFIAALLSAQLLRGRNPVSLVTGARVRGMNFSHDILFFAGVLEGQRTAPPGAAGLVVARDRRGHLQSQCPDRSCAEPEGAGETDKRADHVRDDRSRKAILR